MNKKRFHLQVELSLEQLGNSLFKYRWNCYVRGRIFLIVWAGTICRGTPSRHIPLVLVFVLWDWNSWQPVTVLTGNSKLLGSQLELFQRHESRLGHPILCTPHSWYIIYTGCFRMTEKKFELITQARKQPISSDRLHFFFWLGDFDI